MATDVASSFTKDVMGSHWATCLAGVLGLMLCVSSNESAQATTGVGPYEVPQVVDINDDPNIVETYLVADEADVDIGNGVQARKVLTFKSCAKFHLCDDVVGTIPGPEFRLKVGDTVIVHFKNKLKKEVTGIHWHGVELNNASDGTPLTQEQVKQGDKFDYKFTVTRPGIFWYHPHHHSSTNQVFQGLYGSLIVTETLDTNLQGTVLPSAAQTKTIVLSDITVCKAPGTNDTATYDTSALSHVSGSWAGTWAGKTPKVLCEEFPVDEEGNLRSAFKAGQVPNIMTGPPVGEGQTVLTNGVNVGARAGTPENPGDLATGARTLDVTAGQGLRWQVINSSATRYMRLHLTGSVNGIVKQIDLVRIGGQGGLIDQARLEGDIAGPGFKFNYKQGQILIPPGSRADVVAAIPGDASGVLTLWTEDFQRAGGLNSFAWITTVPVMHLNVSGSGGTYTIANGTPLRPSTDLVKELLPLQGSLLAQGMGSPITFTNSGGQLGVNGIVGDHDHSTSPASARFAQIGDTLELTVTNETGAHHPFHLHGFSIQPVSLSNGTAVYSYPYHEFVDEVDIPSKHTLTFRVRLDDRPNFYDAKGKVMARATPTGGGLGRWLFHCHILFHATLGMISELDVVASPSR